MRLPKLLWNAPPQGWADAKKVAIVFNLEVPVNAEVVDPALVKAATMLAAAATGAKGPE